MSETITGFDVLIDPETLLKRLGSDGVATGHWLEKEGFDIGDSVLVATEDKLTTKFEKKED